MWKKERLPGFHIEGGMGGTLFSFLRTALTPFRMPDLNSSGMPVIYWTGMLKVQFSGRQNHLNVIQMKLFYLIYLVENSIR